MTRPFDPTKFTDCYEEALKALIEAKRKGHAPETVKEPSDTNVIDLVAALKASLGGKGGRSKASKPKRTPAKTKPARRKAG